MRRPSWTRFFLATFLFLSLSAYRGGCGPKPKKVVGCTSDADCSANSSCNLSNGICETLPPMNGCSISFAGNFDSSVVEDDGSCTFETLEAYAQSTQQAFYFFVDAQIDGQSLEVQSDWILSFTSDGQTLVGARLWTGPYTDVPVMGADGSAETQGYMQAGETPVFRIYDGSTGAILDASASQSVPGFSNNLLYTADLLSVGALEEEDEDEESAQDSGEENESNNDPAQDEGDDEVGEDVQEEESSEIQCWDGTVVSDADECPTKFSSGSVDVHFSSVEAIAGFQFNIVGSVITNAYAGAAQDAGLQISFSSDSGTVLAFSMLGTSIPAGSGVLVTLDYEGYAMPCIEDLVLSSTGGASLDGEVNACLHIVYDAVNEGVSQDGEGCTIADAGNYDATADIDDGSCTFNVGEAFNQSMLQGFYFFENAHVDGTPLTADDWVLSFTSDGTTLVGARRWDTSLCGSGVCDLPMMGDDGYAWSSGYMSPGEVPVLKIYDASAGEVYATQTSEELHGFQNLLLQLMSEISAVTD